MHLSLMHPSLVGSHEKYRGNAQAFEHEYYAYYL